MFKLFSQYKPHLRTNKSVMESPVQKIINDAKADLRVCDEEVTQVITHLNDLVVKKGKATGRETETVTTLVADIRRLLQSVLDRREEAEEDIEELEERQRHDMAIMDIKGRINLLHAQLEEQNELLAAAEQELQNFRSGYSLRPAQRIRRPVQELKPIPTVVLAPRKACPKPRVPRLKPAAPLKASVDLEGDYLF